MRKYLCDLKIEKNFLTKTHNILTYIKSGKYKHIIFAHQNLKSKKSHQ